MSVFIISHSSMDLVSVLNLYEYHSNRCDVKIIVSGTEANFKFLQYVGVKKENLIFLQYKTNSVKRNIPLWRYILELFNERKILDDLIKKIKEHKDNKIYFHSYNFDFHAGYLLSKIAPTHEVTLIDVLQLRLPSLSINEIATITGIKLIGVLLILYTIYGNYFFLSGSRAAPMISLHLDKLRFDENMFDPTTVRSNIIGKYRYPISSDGDIIIIYLHSNPFGVTYKDLKTVQDSVLDCLVKYKVSILVKRHPQSEPLSYPKGCKVVEIPSHIPFEFIDLSNVSLVLGVMGASLLGTGEIPTVSLLNVVYSKDSEYYPTLMQQLSKNPRILHIASIDELSLIIARLVASKHQLKLVGNEAFNQL